MSESNIQKAQGRRLSAARKYAGYKSARAAALENSWPESSYRAHENGTRTIGFDDAERYAKRFRSMGVKIDASTILFGGDGPLQEKQGVPLVGHVGADARPDVVVFTTGQGAFEYDVPVPPGAGPTTVAVEVRGNSMRQIAKDGWKIYYEEADIIEGPMALGALYGELCICWLADGRVLFKELHPGKRPGSFFLASTNDDPMPDQMVEKAVRVTFIAPKGPRPATDRLVKDDTSGRVLRKA